jgi:alanyl-tRNA synthetase
MSSLRQELKEVQANSEAVAAENQTELSSLRAELASAQAELESARDQAASDVAEARQELSDMKTSQASKDLKWRSLNADLRTDADNLRNLLEKHKRDDLRSVVLWPSGCGASCSVTYEVVYGIWTKLAARLTGRWAREWAKIPCDKRARYMRKKFLKWCQPYPEPVRVRLLGYFDYMVAPRACSW